MLAALMLFGSLAVGLIWAMEVASGKIAHWDRWAYPGLLAVFVSSLPMLLLMRPGRVLWVKGLVLVALNIHLIGSVHVSLFIGDGPLNTHKLVASVFWLPLCFSGAFVMLPLRAALVFASTTFFLGFLPIAGAFIAGPPARWGEDFAELAVHLALAQVSIFLTMSAIAALRSDHQLAQQRAEQMAALASTDLLTSLPNRRQLTQALSSQLAMAARSAQPVSVMLIDVDHFKRINDNHGHAVGDQTLVALGTLLGRDCRGSDHVGRWGGEEFLVVLPVTPLAQASELAERLRSKVNASHFDHVGQASVSIGVAQSEVGDTLDALLQRADKALYCAKERGRNRVES